MLTHRNLLVAVLLAVVVVALMDLNWYFFVLIGLFYLVLTTYGSTQIQSNFHIEAFCHGSKTDKILALSFDDGIHEEITSKVLDILKKYQAKATFFCIGRHLETEMQAALLRRADAEGHLIGNHSYSHSNFFDFYSTLRVQNELQETNAKVEQIIGKKMRLFRPPYGITNPPIARAVRKLDFQVVGWSVRSLDTTIKDLDKLFGRVANRIHPGAVLLLHDNHDRVPAFLERFLEYVLRQGYQIVPLDELLDIEPYR